MTPNASGPADAHYATMPLSAATATHHDYFYRYPRPTSHCGNRSNTCWLRLYEESEQRHGDCTI